MSTTVCELCGGTEFRKEAGEFVCQKCGCRYSLEDARKLVRDDRPTLFREQGGSQAGYEHQEDLRPAPSVLGEALTAVAASVAAASWAAITALADPRDINNAACNIMVEAVQRYKQVSHPDAAALRELVADATACFAALDRASSIDLNAHAQNVLIFENCAEIRKLLGSCCFYKEDQDGKEVRTYFRSTKKEDFPMPVEPLRSTTSGSGAVKDWRDVDWRARSQADREFLRNGYLNAHPETMARKEELAQLIDAVESQLDSLKAEKKDKGFFNFAEKREVKDRMEPAKEQLADLRSQAHEIDQITDNFIDACVDELVKTGGFERLDF